MQLNNWSSFFEIFAVLNIGYASFEFFRKVIYQDVFQRGRLSNRLSVLISEIALYISEEDENSPIYSRLLQAKKRVEYEEDYLINKEKTSKCFIELFKSISLILSLYSITVLIIAGFQAQSSVSTSESYNVFIFFLAIGTSAYCYTVFFSSLFNRMLINSICTLPLQTVIIFLLCLTSSIFMLIFQSSNLIFSIILLLLIPLITYITITLFNFLRIEEYKIRKAKDFINSLFNYIFTWKTLGLIFKFLVSISIFLIPIIIYFNIDDGFWKSLIFNTIILINPVLLYILLTIRIFIHRKRFKKEYLRLSNEYTSKFEGLRDLMIINSTAATTPSNEATNTASIDSDE